MTEVREIKTDEFTIKSGHLDVGDGHEVYYEQWGNPKAQTPILLFHGGPGSQYRTSHKYNFDPRVHQVIAYDQRGAGNSLPYGKLEHNTTDDLLSDAHKILDELRVETVYVYGGSWGSTLALLFSLRYPKHTKAAIIKGVFTGTQAEIDYIDKGYFVNFYPEVWQRFVASVPATHRNDPAQYHYDKLLGNDKTAWESSAKALAELEGPLLNYDWPGYNDIKPDSDPTKPPQPYDYVPYQIFAHYLSQSCFLKDNEIVSQLPQLKTPLYIVQGRYDMCCPPITAHRVATTAPRAQLFMTLGSHGHDAPNRVALQALIATVFV